MPDPVTTKQHVRGLIEPAAMPTGSPRRPTAASTREIATAVADAYKRALGSGPGKISVHLASPATLVVLLESTMTVEERTLARLGQHERLREQRLAISAALEGHFRSIVERALGRRTFAFVSGIDTRRDIAVDVFTLGV
jgi:uncharacterized protein YbcI